MILTVRPCPKKIVQERLIARTKCVVRATVEGAANIFKWRNLQRIFILDCLLYWTFTVWMMQQRIFVTRTDFALRKIYKFSIVNADRFVTNNAILSPLFKSQKINLAAFAGAHHLWTVNTLIQTLMPRARDNTNNEQTTHGTDTLFLKSVIWYFFMPNWQDKKHLSVYLKYCSRISYRFGQFSFSLSYTFAPLCKKSFARAMNRSLQQLWAPLNARPDSALFVHDIL